jgi:hypothetical protein
VGLAGVIPTGFVSTVSTDADGTTHSSVKIQFVDVATGETFTNSPGSDALLLDDDGVAQRLALDDRDDVGGVGSGASAGGHRYHSDAVSEASGRSPFRIARGDGAGAAGRRYGNSTATSAAGAGVASSLRRSSDAAADAVEEQARMLYVAAAVIVVVCCVLATSLCTVCWYGGCADSMELLDDVDDVGGEVVTASEQRPAPRAVEALLHTPANSRSPASAEHSPAARAASDTAAATATAGSASSRAVAAVAASSHAAPATPSPLSGNAASRKKKGGRTTSHTPGA